MFLIGGQFVWSDDATLVLGENTFYGQRFSENLQAEFPRKSEATVFGYRGEERSAVADPRGLYDSMVR